MIEFFKAWAKWRRHRKKIWKQSRDLMRVTGREWSYYSPPVPRMKPFK